MNIPTRQLGTSGPVVPAIGFGCMGLSAYYAKPLPDVQRFEILDRALEIGETFWDTADVYMDNEDFIGSWFKKSGSRSKIFLATKFGNTQASDGTFIIRSDPTYIKSACEKSLKRLGIDFVDLYYCHRCDKVTPIEETVKAMVELKEAGKIKYLGLSEVSSSTLRRAHAIHPITAVQVEYSPFSLDIESPQIGLLDTCRELGVAVVAYSPFGRGIATGMYTSKDDFEDGDFRKEDAPRYNQVNFPKNLILVNALKEMASKKGCTQAQLTLAWLLAQGDDIIPIPGTTKIKYLEENFDALKVKLTVEEVKEIRKVIEGCEVHGTRYPDFMSGSLFADTPPL